jgi:hypothetical protein
MLKALKSKKILTEINKEEQSRVMNQMGNLDKKEAGFFYNSVLNPLHDSIPSRYYRVHTIVLKRGMN